MIRKYHLRIPVLLAGCMMAGSLSAQAPARPALPVVTLRGDQGGFADGRPWTGPPKGSIPTVVAILHPDREEHLDRLAAACARAGIPRTDLAWHAIYLTKASWMPDRLLQLGHWVRKMSATLQEARTDGIVQAFLTGRPDQWAWETVYDRENLVLRRWHLDDVPFQIVVVGPDGRMMDHKSGDISTRTGQEWAARILAVSARKGG